MTSNKNVRYGQSAIRGAIGVALMAFAVYWLFQRESSYAEIDLEPAKSPPEPHPYYDAHPHNHQETLLPKAQRKGHPTNVGNLPGERNQIGGRASGKRARYN